MVEIFSGTRPATDAFLKFRVSMEFVKNSGLVQNSKSLFESEVRDRHSFLSFQHPDKIADAIRLFSTVQLWQEVAVKLSMPPADIKTTLRLIVDRRNKIAHEADSDPSYPGARWPITEHDVEKAIAFIESLCEAMHSIPL
ncbi:MAG: HEPN domain-containing protein [Candidatus Methylumidiphilus sp.]